MAHSCLASCLVLEVFLMVFAPRLEACSPLEGGPPPFQHSVNYAAAIIMGRVIRTFPDLRFTDAYSAEMEIYCIPKSPESGMPEIKLVQNVSEAGFIPGHCTNNVLEIGKSYIVLLYESNRTYKPMSRILELNSENIDELGSTCGLSPSVPEGASGYSAQGTVVCPRPVDDNGCYTNTTITEEAPRDPATGGETAQKQEINSDPVADDDNGANVILGTAAIFWSLVFMLM